MYFITAFTIGLFGSLHCVGMCGPIALALPGGKQAMLKNVLLYNLGRIFTYVMLGAVIGMLGKGLVLAGMQRWLSIAIGLSLLIIALFSIPVESRLIQLPLIGRVYLFVKNTLARLLGRSGPAAFFRTGLLNGLLPCGLVYLAIAGAVTAGSLGGSMLYMLLFGLGTVPLMAITVFAGQKLSFSFRRQFQQLYPLLLFALAGIFLFRGLHFHLPEQFSFWEMMQDVPMCY